MTDTGTVRRDRLMVEKSVTHPADTSRLPQNPSITRYGKDGQALWDDSDLLLLDITIYDASEVGALLHVDWTAFNIDGPLFLRCKLVPYDAERLIWVAYAASRPIAIDLARGVIHVGSITFRANVRALEPFIR